jgi:hypothetical protein
VFAIKKHVTLSKCCRIAIVTNWKYIPDQVKEGEMGRACSTNGAKRNAYIVLVGNPERKKPLGRPRRRCVDNIKIERQDEMVWTRFIWLRIGTTGELL